MKQLGNQDAGFIYNETPTTPMHIAGVGIYDQSSAPGGRLGHKDIIKYVQDRIHFAPIFRQKLVEVPFGLDRPYWIEDPDFDIEFHLRHIALPQPGDWRQLCILISRLNSRPIDFRRPLWEAYIIEGLDNVEGLPKGSFAIMVKVHHSAVDGSSGQGIFGALHDLSPDATPIAPDKPLTIERMPTNLELMARSVGNIVSRPMSQTKGFYNKAPNMIRHALKLYRGEMAGGTSLKVPQTRFNKTISPHRVFDGTHFSIDEVKYVKNTIGQGTTVNDVMLNIVAGGLRRYLSHHHELPEATLCAMLPQDIRKADDTEMGNKVGGLFASLNTNIEEPVKRLLAIHQDTSAAKHLAESMDTAPVIQNYMGGFLSPNLGRGMNKLMQRTRLLERAGPFATNTLVTNVPGPNFPLYHAGAKMVSYWGIPPVMDCLGLGHAVFSYCGQISLSVTACREMMPDPAFYTECLNESFAEILAAAKAIETQQDKPAEIAKPRKRQASSSTKATAAAKPEAAKAETKTSAAKTAPAETSTVAKSETAKTKTAKSKTTAPKTAKAKTTKAKSAPKAKTETKPKAPVKTKAAAKPKAAKAEKPESAAGSEDKVKAPRKRAASSKTQAESSISAAPKLAEDLVAKAQAESAKAAAEAKQAEQAKPSAETKPSADIVSINKNDGSAA